MINYQKVATIIKNEPNEEDAFYLFISSLKDVKWDRFQIRMCLDFIHSEGYTCLNWCRAAGKTEKSAILAVFFLIRGEEVYWYASTTKQLVQAMKYWQASPYILDFTPQRTRTRIDCVTGATMGVSCLSEKNASGPRAGVVFYDEVALMKQYDLIKSFGVANHVSHPRFLLFSTPILESIFHDFVRKYGANKVVYTDCSWFNYKFIESQKIKGLEYIWEQENLCKFIAAEGSVFPEDHIHLIEMSQQFIKDKFAKKQIIQGVDFGGAKGHNLCRIAVTHNAIYILKEEVFQYKYDDEILQVRCNEYATEIEVGFWNDTHAPNLRNVSRMEFSGGRDGTKISRIRMLLMKPIYIDKALTPNTLKDIRSAVWSKTAKNDDKIETNHLDYLSALMHAIKEHTDIEYENITVNDAYNSQVNKNPWAPKTPW